MCFNAINGSGPAYLSELLHVCIPSRTLLRSSSDTRMMKIKQYKRKTHGFRTFCCFGPRIRNSLPQDLRHRSTPLLEKNCTGFPFQNVLNIKHVACMCFSAINGSDPAYVSYTTLFFCHLHTENPAIQTQDSWLSRFLSLLTPHLDFTPTRP